MLKRTWTLDYFSNRNAQPEDGHHNILTQNLFDWVRDGFLGGPAAYHPLGDPYKRTLIAADAIDRVAELTTRNWNSENPPQIWCSYIPHPEECFGECRYFILFKFENNGDSYLFELRT